MALVLLSPLLSRQSNECIYYPLAGYVIYYLLAGYVFVVLSVWAGESNTNAIQWGTKSCKSAEIQLVLVDIATRMYKTYP